ncbi:hypothetical protein [Tistrella mobilis]|uniref:Uncharacterized protein n=1 Tax=Tistrella mobilis (strain KA081020-065) TaxID=1110502 RepID=I3TRT0_TISMK|nr:hypothetical protein [Tistrella mobilis]AFK55468.1 hypothetical protein TMO_a0065 [Tistrella mobilis KA081020-065]
MADPTLSEEVTSDEDLMSGMIPVGVGAGSVVRIPIPGTPGFAVGLETNDSRRRGRSTSTLFLQDITGKRVLRLDYGYNPRSGCIDYHWNQDRVHKIFGVSDHTPGGRIGALAYESARAYKYGGRVLVIAGVAIDMYSIVVADRPIRRTVQVVSGWTGAWLGCRGVGQLGAMAGTFVEPGLGTGVGALGGCIVGGIGGYALGEAVSGEVYDWAADTFFTPLPETALPDTALPETAPSAAAGGARP